MRAANYQPITQQLISLIGAHPEIGTELKKAISDTASPNIHDLDELYEYVDVLVQTVPDASSQLIGLSMEIYYLSAHSEFLLGDKLYQMWLVHMAEAWGSFLDTPASTAQLSKYFEDPAYKVKDYDRGPSGWMSFNQFFARQIRPGLRPIAQPLDPKVVVSPCDGKLIKILHIDEDAEICSKGLPFKISQLLDGSPYAEQFKGGLFTHTFLDVADYHRYHTPVAGKVLEARLIPGQVEIEFKYKDGKLTPEPVLNAGYLFTQDRGLLVLESSAGLVAIAPIGMAQISSITITPPEGTHLEKGEQMGYFQFGGSDVVVLYQHERVTIECKPDDKLLQGQRVALVN